MASPVRDWNTMAVPPIYVLVTPVVENPVTPPTPGAWHRGRQQRATTAAAPSDPLSPRGRPRASAVL